MTTTGIRRLVLHRPGADDSRWPLARIFAVGATAAAVVAVVAIALGGVALFRLTDTRNALIDVAAPAVASAQLLTGALVNQESGIRGFGLTGRAEFLTPYRDGTEAERVQVATLRELAAAGGLAGVPADVDAVEAAAQAWHAGYAEGVLAGAAPGPSLGHDLFEHVRDSTKALETDVGRYRDAARVRLDEAASFLTVAGIAIAAVLAAFLAATAVGLRRGVLRPVSELAAQVRGVVSVDVEQPVRAAGPREIMQLGADVEAMRVRILADLDEARATNRRLDDQARDLERSNRDLEQFAYVASHDLQEPLRKVSSFCQLLQRRYGGRLDERADQYIEFAVDGASRMQLLINDLLSFSRVGRTAAGFTPVALDEVAAAAVAQVEPARADVAGEVVLGELPTVTGDATLLRQLLVNLIGNGLKFHRDGVPPVVTVTARAVDDGWEMSVTDNGIGIEPEYADKVFVIFQRLHGRDLYPGTGIGLALAKKIVEFHGGRIHLDPADGPGTVVRVTLPADPASKENP